MGTLTGTIAAINAASPFNSAQGFEVGDVGEGRATLRLSPRPDALNHAGLVHAGVTAALLDTVAGYAAASVAGGVVTASMTVNYIAGAKGAVEATAEVLKAGNKQVFVDARVREGERLIATASVVLLRL